MSELKNNTAAIDIAARAPSDPHPSSLTVQQARQTILDAIEPILAPETMSIRDALDRVLAADVISPIDVPPHDNSAMDGYAFAGACLQADASVTLKPVGTALAGCAFQGRVMPGECIRIMTGATLPTGCDTVAPQESVLASPDTAVTIPAGAIQPGDNRRLMGEDLQAGTAALKAGKILRPADIGLLASLGMAHVAVQRRLRVALFSTGDELRSIGETLEEGQVYDSNRYTIHGMLTRLGCEVIDMGVVKDDPASLDAALRAACEQGADAILTSGGVSVGAADYTRTVMAQLGEVAFWQVAMRPGRPLAFGRIASNGRHATLFGLPGNPVAAMVSFYFFVRDALLRMMGARAAPLPLMRTRSPAPIRKKAGRTEFQRGIVSTGDDGLPQVHITGSQGSGILRSMSEANCIVVLQHEQADVAAGDMVEVLLFEGLV